MGNLPTITQVGHIITPSDDIRIKLLHALSSKFYPRSCLLHEVSISITSTSTNQLNNIPISTYKRITIVID